ncbi:hypothetical protein ACG9ZL_19840 [Acinetobacter sp. ULE_I057]|uniref:hypothetical protein n=1 Tax=Acinetobacter sp. ULE_I057 TaxID=3373070 RepID=UPI003AF5139E
MAQPYNYMLDIPNPVDAVSQSMANGFNMAASVDKAQQQREQVAIQKAQQSKMNSDLQYLSNNPSPENYSKVMTLYPQLSENLKRSYETMDDGKKKTTLSLASQSYAALMNNQPEVAKQVLNDAATAYENSGQTKDAGVLRGYAKMVENNPNAARTSIGMLMASTNPDKFADIYGKLGDESRASEMQPLEMAKTEAETAKINAEAGDIPLAAADRAQGVINQGNKIEYDNQYNFDKLGQDQQQFLASLEQKDRILATKMAAVKKETSTQKVERLEKAQSFATAAVNASSTAKLAAELINDYKKLSDASGAGVWNAAMRNIPGTAEYDFARRVETLKSQAFLIGAQNLKGLGAMTEIEGKKATDALGNLDLSQNTKQVAMQLADIAKAANNVAQAANKNAQIYSTKGQGYSQGIKDAAKELGISEAEAQLFANENGL